ncbi:MAG: helix-turn-helix domain-containing protein [Bacteroidales bacterium]|nr:helix-turn-helix domain-containing protein [Candidatus Cacconaster merdequi]
MEQYTFEMVPGLIGEITELLRSINNKLDRLPSNEDQNVIFPEWMSVNDLNNYLPTHPATTTIYSWVHENEIPFYKRGKKLTFKKSEIDEWLLHSRRKTHEEIAEEARKYCAAHPIGGRRR